MTNREATIDIAKLPEWGVLQAKGEKAASFLQGQITRNIELVTPEQPRLAACCNNKGRVLAIFCLQQLPNEPDAYYLILPRETLPSLQQHLKKYAMFDRVALTDVSDSLNVYGLWHQGQCQWQLCPTGQPHPFNAASTTEISAEQWQAQRICAGLPFIYADTVGKFLPHPLNLPHLGLVDFDKGCYTGQEIIARTEFLGKVKQTIVIAEEPRDDNKPYRLGEECQVGKFQGQCVDLALTDELCFALMLLKKP